MKFFWPAAPASTPLLANQAHVWCAGLDLAGESLQLLEALLSTAERERLRSFRFERDRRRCIARRGILRTLLSRYLDCDPAEVQFTYGPRGKPALAAFPGILEGQLAFNLSHSAGVALFAIARQPLGVDLELIRTDLAHTALAQRYFSPVEQAALRALPPGQQLAAFFYCWTRKEALVKALGEGLSISLDSFDVSVTAGQARLLAWRGPGATSLDWQLVDLEPGPGFAAALALAGEREWQIERWQLKLP